MFFWGGKASEKTRKNARDRNGIAKFFVGCPIKGRVFWAVKVTWFA